VLVAAAGVSSGRGGHTSATYMLPADWDHDGGGTIKCNISSFGRPLECSSRMARVACACVCVSVSARGRGRANLHSRREGEPGQLAPSPPSRGRAHRDIAAGHRLHQMAPRVCVSVRSSVCSGDLDFETLICRSYRLGGRAPLGD
jgi:hypothetical protein